MRSLMRLLAVFFICFVGIGLYLGWFSLSNPNPEPDGNKVNVNVSVDKAKMKSDIRKVEEKVEAKVENLEHKLKAGEEIQ